MNENMLLLQRMYFAQNKIDGVYYLLGRNLGINENELAVIYALADEVPHTQKEICTTWILPRTTVNSVIKRLEKSGFVSLSPCEHGKEKEILLTDSGKKYISTLLGSIFDSEEAAMRKTLEKYDSKFIEALEFYAENLKFEYERKSKENKAK